MDQRDVISLKDSDSQTVLHIAASQGHQKAMEMLLGVIRDSGLEMYIVWMMDAGKQTELHLATLSDSHLQVAEQQLSVLGDVGVQKFPISMKDVDGQTALHLAAMDGHLQVMDQLLGVSEDAILFVRMWRRLLIIL